MSEYKEFKTCRKDRDKFIAEILQGKFDHYALSSDAVLDLEQLEWLFKTIHGYDLKLTKDELNKIRQDFKLPKSYRVMCDD